MANYAVTDWASNIGPLADVVAEVETYLETIDTTKTIRLATVQNISGNSFQACIVHDA